MVEDTDKLGCFAVRWGLGWPVDWLALWQGCRDPLSSRLSSLRRPFPSEEKAENDDDVYRSLEELAE